MDTDSIDELLDLWKVISGHIYGEPFGHRDVQEAIYKIIHDKIATLIKEKEQSKNEDN